MNQRDELSLSMIAGTHQGQTRIEVAAARIALCAQKLYAAMYPCVTRDEIQQLTTKSAVNHFRRSLPAFFKSCAGDPLSSFGSAMHLLTIARSSSALAQSVMLIANSIATHMERVMAGQASPDSVELVVDHNPMDARNADLPRDGVLPSKPELIARLDRETRDACRTIGSALTLIQQRILAMPMREIAAHMEVQPVTVSNAIDGEPSTTLGHVLVLLEAANVLDSVIIGLEQRAEQVRVLMQSHERETVYAFNARKRAAIKLDTQELFKRLDLRGNTVNILDDIASGRVHAGRRSMLAIETVEALAEAKRLGFSELLTFDQLYSLRLEYDSIRTCEQKIRDGMQFESAMHHAEQQSHPTLHG